MMQYSFLISLLLSILITVAPLDALARRPSPTDSLAIEFDGHVYFHTLVNQQSAHFIFDTGSPYECFDSTFVAAADLQFNDMAKAKMGGVGNNVSTVPLILDRVNINILGRNIVPKFIPIIQLKPVLGDYADGIVGIEYFKNNVFEIDYNNQRMRFLDRNEIDSLTDYTPLDIVLENDRAYLPATVIVNDSLQFTERMLIDLGAGGEVTLTSATAARYRLAQTVGRRERFYSGYGGLGGDTQSDIFLAKGLKLASFEWSKVYMDYSVDSLGALSDRSYAGIIGNEIWRRFDIVFDFASSKMYLRKNAYYDKPFTIGTYGFSFTNRSATLGCWIVTGMTKGSHAEEAGLKIDDRILSFNGTPVTSFPLLHELYGVGNFTEISLEIERHGQRSIITFATESPTRLEE